MRQISGTRLSVPLPATISAISRWCGLSSPCRPRIVTCSSPFMPSDCQDVPSSNTSGITPMPIRFERWMRSNLIGMGVMPLVFEEGTSWQSLGMKGDEQVTIRGLHGELKPHQRLIAEIVAGNGTLKRVPLICRIDTLDELDYFKNGGILQYVLRHLAA